MPTTDEVSRRWLFTWIGTLFTGSIGALLAVPVVRYLMSPMIRAGHVRPEDWLSLGTIEQFPPGETRLATFRTAAINPGDGVTAETACWVRHIEPGRFQVFAINCAHLGCPVRWFPASRLFMCPCHGGAYYADGQRASGPPERGLFEYEHRAEGGVLMIKPGGLPTPGTVARRADEATPCA